MSDTTDSTTPAAVNTFDTWLAETLADTAVVAIGSPSYTKGNAATKVRETVAAFVKSGHATLTLTDQSINGWTRNRKGADATQASIGEAFADVRAYVNTQADSPVIASKVEDTIRLVNVAVDQSYVKQVQDNIIRLVAARNRALAGMNVKGVTDFRRKHLAEVASKREEEATRLALRLKRSGALK